MPLDKGPRLVDVRIGNLYQNHSRALLLGILICSLHRFMADVTATASW